MKIKDNVLLKVEKSDIINGVLNIPDEVTEIGNDAICNLPTLQEVHGKNVKTVGNWCFYDSPCLTNISLPNAETFGDYCFRFCPLLTSVNLPSAQTVGGGCFRSCRSLTSINGKRAGCIDGYPMLVESETTKKGYTIILGTWIGKMKEGHWVGDKVFVAQKDGFSAHGKTAKQAIQDVEFKILSEKMKSKPLGMEDVVTIPRYRAITGACQAGVEKWMQDNNLSATEIKVKDLLPLLEYTQAYGVDKFKQLIKEYQQINFYTKSL